MGPESQCETVLLTEFRQHSLGFGLSIDGDLQIGGDLHVLAALVGAIPAPVGLRSLDMRQAVLGHYAFFDEPRDIVDVDLAPGALPGARRITLQEALLIEPFALAVDPAPAENDIDSFFGRDRFEARINLVNLDPDFISFVVMLGEPLVKTRSVLERADLLGIDYDWRH